MSNHFASPTRRITRAKRHIDNIKTEIEKFLSSQPYARFVERNMDGFDEHKMKLTRPLPEEITDLSYEAIEAMRSALDQALHPVAILGKARRPDLIHFPIGNDAADFENILNGKYMKDLPPDVLRLFGKLKPYQGGNDVIWALNRIRRQSTHRLLIPVGNATAGIHIRSMTGSGTLSTPRPIWDREKNEVIFAVTDPASNLEYDVNFAFFVAFGPVDGVAGQPLVETLNAMLKQVESIVAAIEAECWVIGLIN